MLIICPKCFAQYDVPGTLDPKKNQEFHCSNCNHYFVADDVAETADPDSVLDTPALQPLSDVYPNPIDEVENLKMPKCLEDSPRQEPVALNPDLGYIPEEFKPVSEPKKKKASVWVVLIYLGLIGAAAYAGFWNRDLIWTQFKNVWSDNGLPALDRAVITVPDDKPMAQAPTVVAPEETPTPPTVLGTLPVSQSEPVQTPVVQAPVNPVALAMAERLDVVVAASTTPVPATETPKPVMDLAALKEILKIQDISYQLGLNEEGINRLLIEGNLVNTDLIAVDTPDLTAVVYDKQDVVVARKQIVPSQKTIQGNTKEPFYTSVVPAPESVGRVEVNFEE